MARKNFWHVKGQQDIRSFGAKSGATIAIGDPVIKDNSTGYVDIATTTSNYIAGIAQSAVTSASAGDAILVDVSQDSIYECTCSGTATQAMVMDAVEIDGSTGAFQVDENATTYPVFKIEELPDGTGANVRVYGRFIKSEFGTLPATTVGTSDLVDASVTADKLAAAVAGAGLTGGAGTALAVGAGNGISVAADAIAVAADSTTGATVAPVAVGANGVGVTISATGGLQHTAGSVSIKPDSTTGATVAPLTVGANGAGVTISATGGLQHTAGTVSIKPDSTTGATVAPITTAANGAGITIDNSTLEHTAGSLHVKNAGVGVDQLAAAVAGNGLTGGAGSALAVGAGNGISVAADAVAVNPDTTTGATVCALTVGANGAGVTVDTTTIEHAANSLRIAASAAGNGLTGGGGSALAVGAGNGITVAADAVAINPDTTTGATVCALAVGANGAGVTVDNATIVHAANVLGVGTSGIGATQLSATALAATKIPDFAVGAAGYAIPFVCAQLYADAGTVNIFNANAPFKFRIILWWNHALDATASNVKLNNGANDITTNLAHGASDHAIVMGTDLDNAYYEIAANGTLAVITDGAGSDGVAYCLCVPVA